MTHHLRSRQQKALLRAPTHLRKAANKEPRFLAPRLLFLSLAMFHLPFAVRAQDVEYLKELARQTGEVVSTLTVIVFALILLVFLWGLVKFVWGASGDEKAQGKAFMFWGVVALFVAAAVWGIVAILRNLVGASEEKSKASPSLQQNTFQLP